MTVELKWAWLDNTIRPSGFDKSRGRLCPDMTEWMEAHDIAYEIDLISDRDFSLGIYFETEDDEVLFKLRWL